MRAFVAIDVGRPLSGGPDAGSGDEAPPHLTLRFFAEIGPDEVERVSSAVDEVARATGSFDLSLEGIGAFPSAERPRVVWLAVARGREEVVGIGRRLDLALARIGFPPEPRELVPHVTLFRVRSARDRERASALLGGRTTAPTSPPVRVREITLKESVLGPGGARHRIVRAFPLGDGPGSGR